ncbi:other/FunK1 protein kinase [Coprinopsis cinerea AmutBmut pab1-1]|nr:other/FunK1 protein kinase [Coprinopsis cinerea AmutBmut pab1-1]
MAPYSVAGDSKFHKTLYEGVTTDENISAYLEKSEYYNSGSWTLAPYPDDAEELRDTVGAIIKEIEEYFWPMKTTKGLPFICVGNGCADYKEAAMIECHWEVMLDDDDRMDDVYKTKIEEHQLLEEHITDAFISQPARQFLRVLFVSENKFRVVHFDRSGVKYSIPANLHDDPLDFVRLVVGLTSCKADLIGFDTSLVFNKRDPEILVQPADAMAPSVYIIEKIIPPGDNADIYWQTPFIFFAHTPDGNKVVVKEFWFDGLCLCDPEPRLLAEALGLKGVVQMIEYQVVAATTDFRGPLVEEEQSHYGFQKRTKLRMVLEQYGSDIHYFESKMDLLTAFYDAIKGHMRLYLRKGILHRDISVGNILLGLKGSRSRKGFRGVLIDLDKAIYIYGHKPGELKFAVVGTIPYQSVFVQARAFLSCTEHPNAFSNHDHLDDLQSFFWVFLYIVIGFTAPGRFRSGLTAALPLKMDSMFEESNERAHDAKSLLLREDIYTRETVESHVPEFWGPIIKNLLAEFRAWTIEMYNLKFRVLHNFGTNMTKEQLMARAKEHYTAVLRMFENAIEELEVEEQIEAVESEEELDDDLDSVLGKRDPSSDPVSLNSKPAPKKARADEPAVH